VETELEGLYELHMNYHNIVDINTINQFILNNIYTQWQHFLQIRVVFKE
jgi:hypothetical protein